MLHFSLDMQDEDAKVLWWGSETFKKWPHFFLSVNEIFSFWNEMKVEAKADVDHEQISMSQQMGRSENKQPEPEM